MGSVCFLSPAAGSSGSDRRRGQGEVGARRFSARPLGIQPIGPLHFAPFLAGKSPLRLRWSMSLGIGQRRLRTVDIHPRKDHRGA